MGEKPPDPVQPDSHPEIKPGDETPGVPFTISADEAAKEAAAARREKGPVPIGGGVKIVIKP